MNGPAAGHPSGAAITDQEFALFQRLIYKIAGISLSDAKKVLLSGASPSASSTTAFPPSPSITACSPPASTRRSCR
jgi:hypothetical protein